MAETVQPTPQAADIVADLTAKIENAGKPLEAAAPAAPEVTAAPKAKESVFGKLARLAGIKPSKPLTSETKAGYNNEGNYEVKSLGNKLNELSSTLNPTTEAAPAVDYSKDAQRARQEEAKATPGYQAMSEASTASTASKTESVDTTSSATEAWQPETPKTQDQLAEGRVKMDAMTQEDVDKQLKSIMDADPTLANIETKAQEPQVDHSADTDGSKPFVSPTARKAGAFFGGMAAAGASIVGGASVAGASEQAPHHEMPQATFQIENNQSENQSFVTPDATVHVKVDANSAEQPLEVRIYKDVTNAEGKTASVEVASQVLKDGEADIEVSDRDQKVEDASIEAAAAKGFTIDADSLVGGEETIAVVPATAPDVILSTDAQELAAALKNAATSMSVNVEDHGQITESSASPSSTTETTHVDAPVTPEADGAKPDEQFSNTADLSAAESDPNPAQAEGGHTTVATEGNEMDHQVLDASQAQGEATLSGTKDGTGISSMTAEEHKSLEQNADVTVSTEAVGVMNQAVDIMKHNPQFKENIVVMQDADGHLGMYTKDGHPITVGADGRVTVSADVVTLSDKIIATLHDRIDTKTDTDITHPGGQGEVVTSTPPEYQGGVYEVKTPDGKTLHECGIDNPAMVADGMSFVVYDAAGKTVGTYGSLEEIPASSYTAGGVIESHILSKPGDACESIAASSVIAIHGKESTGPFNPDNQQSLVTSGGVTGVETGPDGQKTFVSRVTIPEQALKGVDGKPVCGLNMQIDSIIGPAIAKLGFDTDGNGTPDWYKFQQAYGDIRLISAGDGAITLSCIPRELPPTHIITTDSSSEQWNVPLVIVVKAPEISVPPLPKTGAETEVIAEIGALTMAAGEALRRVSKKLSKGEKVAPQDLEDIPPTITREQLAAFMQSENSPFVMQSEQAKIAEIATQQLDTIKKIVNEGRVTRVENVRDENSAPSLAEFSVHRFAKAEIALAELGLVDVSKLSPEDRAAVERSMQLLKGMKDEVVNNQSKRTLPKAA